MIIDNEINNSIDRYIGRIVKFCEFLRENNFDIGIKNTLSFFETVHLETLLDRNFFKNSLKSFFCSCREDFHNFNELFNRFWDKAKSPQKDRLSKKSTAVVKIIKSNMGSSTISNQEAELIEDENDQVGASKLEALKRHDISTIPLYDHDLFDQIALKLWYQMSYRIRRRYKKSRKVGRINFRKTIRASISKGGEPFSLIHKKKQKEKANLVIFLDVSGSMDRYSYFYLQFIHILSKTISKVDVFTFSTKLVKITKEVKSANFTELLNYLSIMDENNWSSGTTMVSCFDEFTSLHSKYLLTRRTPVIIFSDGLDTDEPQLLLREILKIKNSCKEIIWLNPLKGMENYQPITRSMSTIHPFLDQFLSARTLSSLTLLEEVITNALGI